MTNHTDKPDNEAGEEHNPTTETPSSNPLEQAEPASEVAEQASGSAEASAHDSPPPAAAQSAPDASGPQPPTAAAAKRTVWKWLYPLNTILLLGTAISLFSASDDSPTIGWLALIVGFVMAVPFAFTWFTPRNIFVPYLPRINKTALIILALLPIWQMNLFLLNDAEIPILQHLVSLILILALCCLIMVDEKKKRDFDRHALTQHLALRAVDNAGWVYSFGFGIVMTLLTCLIVRVLYPDSIVDIKLLSRGLIPPITLMLFYVGLTDLSLRFWNIFSQSRDRESALNMLLTRLTRRKRDTIIEAIYTGMDRSGELNRYLVWAIPILGFIGTVLGISLAAQGMGAMLSSASQEYSEVLTKALEPLGIAFDTTLIALSLSLVLALAQLWHGTWQDRRIGTMIEVNTPKTG